MPSPSPTPSVSPTPQIKAFEQMMLDSYKGCPTCFVTGLQVLFAVLFIVSLVILVRLLFHHFKKINQPFESFGFLGLSMAEKKAESNTEPTAAEQFTIALNKHQEDIDTARTSIEQLTRKLNERNQLDERLSRAVALAFREVNRLESNFNSSLKENFLAIEKAFKQLENNVVTRKMYMQDLIDLNGVDSDNSAKAQENQQAIKHLQDQQMELRAALNELRKSIQEP